MGEGAPIQRWVQLAGYTLIIATALAVLRPFLVPIAWAAILAFATWRIFERVRHALGGRAALAAALMTALVVLLIVIPAVLLSLALAAEIGRTFADFRLSALTVPAGVLAVVRELPWLGPRIADQLVGVLADSAALERLILAHAGGWAAAVATAAGNVGRNVLDAVLALLTLFFLYRDGHLLAPQIQAGLRRVGRARFAAMFDPLGRTVRAVMYGTLFTALSGVSWAPSPSRPSLRCGASGWRPPSALPRPAARLFHGTRLRREHGAPVRPVLEGVEPTDQPPLARRAQDRAGVRGGRARGDARHIRPVAPRVVGFDRRVRGMAAARPALRRRRDGG